MNQMTQEALSNFFNRNYNELLNYSSKASRILTGKSCGNSILAECYIYLDDKRHSLETESDVISWGKTWIKNNLRWPTSPFNKSEKIRPNHCEFQDWGTLTEDSLDHESINKLVKDFESKLSTYDKRLFSIYFEKDLKKGREIAEYLNISISGAYGVINECKEIESRFKEWLKKQV